MRYCARLTCGMWCGLVDKNVAVATITWPPRPARYLTMNMSLFLAFFSVEQICKQGLGFKKETGQKALFNMIAQPAKVLVHFVALNWCKKVVSETGQGKYEETCVMLGKTL